jgi:hypothetical protein
MAPLGESIIVATMVFGSVGFLCLTRPRAVQQWIVLGGDKTGVFPFRRYVSSLAYIIQLRCAGLLSTIAFLGFLFVFTRLLLSLWIKL